MYFTRIILYIDIVICNIICLHTVISLIRVLNE